MLCLVSENGCMVGLLGAESDFPSHNTIYKLYVDVFQNCLTKTAGNFTWTGFQTDKILERAGWLITFPIVALKECLDSPWLVARDQIRCVLIGCWPLPIHILLVSLIGIRVFAACEV